MTCSIYFPKYYDANPVNCVVESIFSCDVTEEDWSQDCIPPKGWPYEQTSAVHSSTKKDNDIDSTAKPKTGWFEITFSGLLSFPNRVL